MPSLSKLISLSSLYLFTMSEPAENTRSNSSSCLTCRSVRLTVKSNVDDKPILLHVEKDQSFYDILYKLCGLYPSIWRMDEEYHFYIEIGGLYHVINDTTWLRGTFNKKKCPVYPPIKKT